MDDLEERLASRSEESDAARRQADRLMRENGDLKRQVESFMSRDDRAEQQYERILEQLKGEISEKERQCHAIEAREA